MRSRITFGRQITSALGARLPPSVDVMTFFSPRLVVPTTISNVFSFVKAGQPLSINAESKVVPGSIVTTSISMDVISSPSAFRRSRMALKIGGNCSSNRFFWFAFGVGHLANAKISINPSRRSWDQLLDENSSCAQVTDRQRR